MERRLLLAMGLMLAVIVMTNLLFPPVRRGPPSRAGDSLAASAEGVGEGPRGMEERAPEVRSPAQDTAGRTEGAGIAERVAEEPSPEVGGEFPADTILVQSPLYALRFVSRGARLISARLPAYRSYAPEDPEGAEVELIRAGDQLFGFRLAVGGDTIDLAERLFEASATSITLSDESPRDSLVLRYVMGEGERGPIAFRVTYDFEADRYLVGVRGEFEGIGDRGYTIGTSLGQGLRTNEADAGEDFQHLAYATKGRNGIRSQRLSSVEAGEREAAPGGPFEWVAVKNKYFVIGYLAPAGRLGFGGLIVDGLADERAARITATLPVPAGSPRFEFNAYLGPQDYERLKGIGDDFQNVNPVGWRWLQPVIRPLVAIVMAILTWMHRNLSLAYGWVLILFGVLMRIVLFPLYQKSMRAQMAQMRVQPLMKDIREKHKDDPQKMQQEMMRLYKEHNINPLAGCLPMLLPFPVLITLFFVFQNTIEFRGVPFLWLPDLSLKDPLYVVPLLMGASMFLLQWIGQRGMESTAQTKMMGYGMPILFTFLFANFPSGLNLYYATSNVASLPQQLYIARERQRAMGTAPRADDVAGGDGDAAGPPTKRGSRRGKGGSGEKRPSAKRASQRAPRRRPTKR